MSRTMTLAVLLGVVLLSTASARLSTLFADETSGRSKVPDVIRDRLREVDAHLEDTIERALNAHRKARQTILEDAVVAGRITRRQAEALRRESDAAVLAQLTRTLRPEPSGGRVTPKQVVAYYDKNRNGFIEESEASPELKPHFAQIDTNGDGQIDLREAQAMADYQNQQQDQAAETPTPRLSGITAKQIVDGLDKNGDGRITKEEATAELKPFFGQIDTNSDGAIDVDEAQVMADYAKNQQAATSNQPKTADSSAGVEQVLKSMDANRDGKIDMDEASEDLRFYFGEFDSNDDGVIDATEAKAIVRYVNGRQRPAPATPAPGQVTAQQIIDSMDNRRRREDQQE